MATSGNIECDIRITTHTQMGEGRAKRTSVVDGRGGKRFKNALEELKELKKSGTKRVDRFEVKEEESVYEEVNEEQYARIVQKRREEGGVFGCFV